MIIWLVMLGVGATAISGLPGMLLPRRSSLGQYLATALVLVGSTLGGAGIIAHLAGISTNVLVNDWSLPWKHFCIGLDALGAIFLVPIFVMSALGSIYGLGYWPQGRNPRTAPRLQLCWGLMAAAMAMVVLARDGVLLLMAWEVMAVAAFLLVGTDDDQIQVRNAAWIYLVASHLSILSLFGFFALLNLTTGSFDLWHALPDSVSPALTAVIFGLGAIGFGLKAGVMPLHFWLPGAHASAPSHVSAFLSGVLLKVGIYGLLRVVMLLQNPPAIWGILLILGTVSALLGVAFALGQHDLKRLLAYHSVENIGIILMGLGVAMIGLSTHRPAWVILGMGGCLLHVWNHGLFKSLLFLTAGSVVHATHTREIDALGGLGRRMPWTAAFFAIGAVAICGLPPLNGFISELLIYLGLFGSVPSKWGGIALVAPILAMVGALAVACFVKALGIVFLGTARTPAAAKAHESPWAMRMPMAVLAAGCVMIGLFSTLLAPLLNAAITSWAGRDYASHTPIESLYPGRAITVGGLLLIAGSVFIGLLYRFLIRHQQPRQAGTWDCGYIYVGPRVQYTASSFAQMLVRIFYWVLRPHTQRTETIDLFPGQSAFHSSVPEVVLDSMLVNVWVWIKSLLVPARGVQHGRVQQYVLYILLALVVLLVLQIPLLELIREMFRH